MSTAELTLPGNLQQGTRGTIEAALAIAKKRTETVAKMRTALVALKESKAKDDLEQVLTCAEELCNLQAGGTLKSLLDAGFNFVG